MKLLVDGVFYQLYRTGIARLWSSVLPRLASCPGLEVIMLDRGNCPSVAGIARIEFPSYKLAAHTAADSLLIDSICKELNVDVFSSTYYTTPVTTPSVLVVYDMIPETLAFNLSQRWWQEKQTAISFASYYVCISENTRSDLLRFYPGIRSDRTIVTHSGVDRDVFRPRDRAQIDDFKRQYCISRPYYTLVGSRGDYKNASLVFTALQRFRDEEIEILCIGGETEIDQDSLARLPSNVSARRLDLSDEELSCAYSGARALVFPSLYEGFGMPVAEAMACGCPVIATRLGALREIAGDAAIFVSGRDPDELREAMVRVREPSCREPLILSGLQRAAARYNWDELASGLFDLAKKASEERQRPAVQNFFQEWKRLREIQAEPLHECFAGGPKSADRARLLRLDGNCHHESRCANRCGAAAGYSN